MVPCSSICLASHRPTLPRGRGSAGNAGDVGTPSWVGNVDHRGRVGPLASQPAQVGRLYFCLVQGVAKQASTLPESTHVRNEFLPATNSIAPEHLGKSPGSGQKTGKRVV